MSVNKKQVCRLPQASPWQLRRRLWHRTLATIAMLGMHSFIVGCSDDIQSGSLSTPVADMTKVSPTPTNVPSPIAPSTPSNAAVNDLPKLQITDLESYKHPSGIMQMNIPKGWVIEDRSQPSEIMLTWNESLGRATLSTNIFVPPSEIPEERLSGVFATIVKGMYGDKTGFEMRAPVIESTGNIVIIWTATIDMGGQKTQFLGNSRFKIVNNKWVILTFGAIEPQFNTLKDFFFSIAKSQIIDGEVAIP